jgi:DNA polymerase-3 subunit alpha
MAVVAAAIERGAGAAEDRRRGQGNLFASSTTEATAEEDYANLPDVSWTESEMLGYEKATLGFYVTSHPLAAYKGQLRGLSTASSQTLNHFGDGEEVVVGGMLSRVHYKVTQNGRRGPGKMALLTIEDLEGPMDAVIFSEELAKYNEFVHAERMVFLRGQISLRRETPSVRVTGVYPIEMGMEVLARSAVVHLACGADWEELLPSLLKVVREYPGSCPLYFRIDTGQGQMVDIAASEQMRVKPSEAFRERMTALLETGRVEIIGPNGPVGLPTDEEQEDDQQQVEEALAQSETD